ncbi:DNA-primase RepB domain-containing protein [Methylosinus sp. PW1]|uniref:DNA-primase RepB domain-containing protein n=1 Tax=Methylosinus sp. PW1 TaxID=107636 RepID=UPI0005655757|nr:DNA-primase RepB domain-containing protein [Methylosinus sp. PW1]
MTEPLLRWAAAMPADRYDIRAVWPDRAEHVPSVLRCVTAAGLPALTPFLKAKNAAGYNLIGRPDDPRFIFVDDISLDTLNGMIAAGHRPCVVVESSLRNFQAFFDAETTEDQTAKALARFMASQWGGDLASADARHAGRLPGFTNRKPKHRRADASYPYARLRTASARLDPVLAAMATDPTALPTDDQQGARAARTLGNCATSVAPALGDRDRSTFYDTLLAPYAARYGATLDRSRADFAIARTLLVQGMPPSEVAEVLSASSKAREHSQPQQYVERTVAAARDAASRRS